MAVFKRGRIWWMDFFFDGRRFQQSTKLKNKRDAEEYERAFRTKLIKGEVGIEPKKEVPVFSQAVKEFLAWSKSEHRDKPNTQQGYQNSCKSYLCSLKNSRSTKLNRKILSVTKYGAQNKRQYTKRSLQRNQKIL